MNHNQEMHSSMTIPGFWYLRLLEDITLIIIRALSTPPIQEDKCYQNVTIKESHMVTGITT